MIELKEKSNLDSETSVFEKHPKTTVAIVFLVFVLLIEICLRFFYPNPYLHGGLYRYARIVEPSMSGVFNSANLYEGGGQCVIKINEKFEIESGNKVNPNLPDAHFLGGSTTESAFVPMGKRWPDMVEGFNTHNHGTSGKNIMLSYYNLMFLLDEEIVKPGDTVFVMNAVNDLRKIVKKYKYKNEMLHYIPFNTINHQLANDFDSFFKNIYLFALFKQTMHHMKHNANDLKPVVSVEDFQVNEASAENLRHRLIDSNLSGQRDEELTDEEFEPYFAKLQDLMSYREDILNKIKLLSKKNNLKLILVTQPNAYTDEYISKNGIYVSPVIKDKNLTRNQTRRVLDVINQQTIDFAKKNEIEYVDVNSEFNKHDLNPLFYDSVHYTIKGSKLFADIINERLNKI